MSGEIYLLYATRGCCDDMKLSDLVGAFDTIEAARESASVGYYDEDRERLVRYAEAAIYDHDTLRLLETFDCIYNSWADSSDWKQSEEPALAQLQVLLERRNLSQAIGDGKPSSTGKGGRL